MGGTAKMNAMRSGVVVMGALAFGYLTLQLGFKPFLERAQLEQQRQEEALAQAQAQAKEQTFDDDGGDGNSFDGGIPNTDQKLL